MMDSVDGAFAALREAGLRDWCETLLLTQQTVQQGQHGHFANWRQILSEMPKPICTAADLQSAAVTATGPCTPEEQAQIRSSLLQFHPWRKGPFDLFGIRIDAEWRSNLKWDRVQPHVHWHDQKILDVGCGNGYYGYRMLGCGAQMVVGLEPYPLYSAQFAAVSALMPPSLPNYVLPANDRALDRPLEFFDIVLSMGVFYHCKDPFGHLAKLKQSLAPGGTLVLETLIVDGDENTILVPENRYAKMRNVWFLPSPLMLTRMLRRVGFRVVEVVDITKTSSDEQRKTEWMTFESLSDFLALADRTRTTEGHPAPQRAIVIAHY